MDDLRRPITFGAVHDALSEDYRSFWAYIMEVLLKSDRAMRGFDLAACEEVTFETSITVNALAFFLGEIEFVIMRPAAHLRDLFRVHAKDPYMMILLETPVDQDPELRGTPNLRGFLAALQEVTTQFITERTRQIA